MKRTLDGDGLRWDLPVLRSLDGYRWAWLPRDLTAGVLVVAVAIPLSMGMAEVAGMPPIVGLYSCVLPLAAYALFGSSRQLIVALDASTAAMVALAVAPVAGGDPIRYAALAGLVALLVGLILVLAGTFRLGFVAHLLSRPVLIGYQAGLALVVVVSQLPRLLGIAVEEDATLPRALEIAGRLDDTSLQTFAVGATCLAVVAFVAVWKPGLPAALFAIVGATLLVELVGPALSDVDVLGELPAGLPPLRIPAFGAADVTALLPISAAIAVLAAADTIVSSRAFARRGGYQVDANRDLIGLGAANLASGLSGGITTSASAARTAVVEMVGGRSQLASVSAAAVMVAVLLFLTRPLEKVPAAALAAVVIGAVLRLIEVGSLRRLWRTRRIEFVIAIATMSAAVAIGLLEGIVTGVALSVGEYLVRAARRRLSRAHEEGGPAADARLAPAPGIAVYRASGPVIFANAHRLRDGARRAAAETPGARRLIVDASDVVDIDATAAETLADLRDDLAARGIELVLSGLNPRVRGVLDRADVPDRLPPAPVVDPAGSRPS
ncbi:MAG: SulP family inorganic anion transporter [Actinomycetota bacterium]